MNRLVPAALVVSAFVAGCAGPGVIAEPAPFEPRRALAQAADARLEATLDAVIVPDGPGTWASKPEWDEYLITVRALSDEPVTITDVAIFDALGHRNPWRGDLSGLQQASRETERLYQASTTLARDRSGAWMIVGGASAVAAGYMAAVGSAVASLMSGAAAASTAGPAAVVVGGVILTVAGVAHLVGKAAVAREIRKRQTVLPATVTHASEIRLDVFFPVTPLPRSVQISYTAGTARHRLDIDTREALAKAHAAGTSAQSRRRDGNREVTHGQHEARPANSPQDR